MGLNLYVKINDEYQELSALAVGPHIKPVAKREVRFCVNYYLDQETKNKCSKNQKNEAASFVKFVDFFNTKNIKYMDEIHYRDLSELENSFLKRMKPSSLNRRFNTFRHFFNKCVEWEYLVESPFKKIKPLSIIENHFKVWSQEEFELFIETTDGVHKTLLMFLYVTGCRPVEARNLKWTDIDYDNKTITFECGKNQGGTRKFPLTDLCSRLFHNMPIDSLHVFTLKKKHIENQNLYHYVKHRLVKLNLNHLTPYGLRHTFASGLNTKEVNAFAIKQLMGHSQIKTTLKYIKNTEKVLIEALEKANR